MGTDNDKKKKKIDKENRDKAIMSMIPLEWIRQPIPLTLMRGDFSPMQVNIMVELVSLFQDRIEALLKKAAEEKEKNPSLFSDEEIQREVYTIRIPLSALDIRPDAYDELDIAAKNLIKMNVSYPSYKDGNKYTNYAPLFSNISIPSRDGYKYKTGNRRVGYIEIKMLTSTLDELMYMNRYNRYLKAVTRSRKCRYTGRLYMFITVWKDFGKKEVDYLEFREMLGLATRDEDNTVVLNKYKNYSDFKKRVLIPAEKELKELKEDNEVDCFFEVSENYHGGPKRGNPVKLVFTIFKSELGKEIESKNTNSKEIIEISNFLRYELQQTSTNCKKILDRLAPQHRGVFKKEMEKAKKYCDNNPEKIISVKSYSWKWLNIFLDDIEPDVVEFDDANNNEGAKTPKPKKQNQPVPSNELKSKMTECDLQKWEKAKEIIRTLISEESFDVWIVPIKPIQYLDGQLVINVPSDFFREMLEEKFVEPLRKGLYGAFGDGAKLMYSVTRI